MSSNFEFDSKSEFKSKPLTNDVLFFRTEQRTVYIHDVVRDSLTVGLVARREISLALQRCLRKGDIPHCTRNFSILLRYQDSKTSSHEEMRHTPCSCCFQNLKLCLRQERASDSCNRHEPRDPLAGCDSTSKRMAGPQLQICFTPLT